MSSVTVSAKLKQSLVPRRLKSRLFRYMSDDCKHIKTKQVNIETVNPYMKELKKIQTFTVFQEADKLEKQIKENRRFSKLEIIRADILDPQALNQPFLSYGREILALMCYRPLQKHHYMHRDTKRRARFMLRQLRGHSIGSYSHNRGIRIVRQNIAKFITKRDGIPCNADNIYMCGGTADGFKSLIKLINSKSGGKLPGVMLPNPHLPFYSALLKLYGLEEVNYNLNMSNQWAINMGEMKRALNDSKNKCKVKAILITNPDVVTGNVLTVNSIKEITKFARNEGLFLIADETYQNNIYSTKTKFHSFKKVQHEMGKAFRDMEMASLMSCSEAYMGECGIQAGYIELRNLEPEVERLFFTYVKVTRTTSILGQMLVDVLVNPPHPQHESYEVYKREKKDIESTLKMKAKLVTLGFNSINGFFCQPILGGMCAFPRVEIPTRAVVRAVESKQWPDEFFALKLLKSTGVCVIPGSYLGQTQGDYHICATILPKIQNLHKMMALIKNFYEAFKRDYS